MAPDYAVAAVEKLRSMGYRAAATDKWPRGKCPVVYVWGEGLVWTPKMEELARRFPRAPRVNYYLAISLGTINRKRLGV